MAGKLDGFEFTYRVVKELTEAARRKALSKIDSRTLRAAMETIVEAKAKTVTGRVYIPQYWAIYNHDGRGPVRAKPGKKLVYFRDPTRDPRISTGYPVRERDIRRLSTSEFYRYLRAGDLIVVESVGPAYGTFFFTLGMRAFTAGIRYRLRAEFSRWMKTWLQKDGLLRGSDTASVRLPNV